MTKVDASDLELIVEQQGSLLLQQQEFCSSSWLPHGFFTSWFDFAVSSKVVVTSQGAKSEGHNEMEEPGAFGKKWRPPREGAGRGLMMYNSLTRSKKEFVPMDENGRKVTMYVCGPTVYDAAHLGHARTYIQFDVIRRVLREVLGYDVTYVMNVTDVDDKIIKRANEKGMLPEKLAREWEAKFLEDMARLNVERPTVMPRVTEYIEEIVEFVAKIVAKKMAYVDDSEGEGKGSVYFDTAAFTEAGFDYAKLVPEGVGNSELLAEGEGKLTQAGIKKDEKDFVLWKKFKQGEPYWDSPWGPGRPGWHIECSAMIEKTIGRGGAIDIHGGGVDLKFPHHDNELAQSEAFCGCGQTVHYFAHTGHLNIGGLKMSKSLKNFTTIKKALDGADGESPVRPSTMRLMFLQCQYNKPADYSEDLLNGARVLEKKFKEFFLNVEVHLRKPESDPEHPQKWTYLDRDLESARLAAETNVRAALMDDFNTPASILALQALVDDVNLYLVKKNADTACTPVVPLVVAACASTVYRYLTIFGLTGLVDPAVAAGFVYGPAALTLQSSEKNSTQSKHALLAPVLDALAKFRDDVRTSARQGQDASKEVLRLCDHVRDHVLPDLGVRLEDKASGSVWKLDDPEVLRQERDRKLAEAAEKERLKQEAAAAKAAKEKAKLQAAKIPPADLFTKGDRAALFSKFDADGLPTHDAQGEALSKSQLKKYKKEFDKQKKDHDDYLATLNPSS